MLARKYIKAVLHTISTLLVVSVILTGCSKKESTVLSGTVESVSFDVNSEAAGKITDMAIDEGSKVKKGDIIAVIDSSSQELAVKQYESLVKIKQLKVDELKAGTRPEQIAQAEAAVRGAESAVDAAQIGVDTSGINYRYWTDKLEALKSQQASVTMPENDLEDAQYKADTAKQQLLASKSQLKTAQAQLDSSKAQLDLLKKGSTAQTLETAEADLEQAEVTLEQARLNLLHCQVKSPADGTCLQLNVNTGDMVNIGTGIGVVSDLTDLRVTVYMPQSHINKVSLGQEVSMTSIGLPGKSIKGKITYIAEEAEFTPKNVETNEAKENTVFKLKIKAMDNIELLKPGMTVEVPIP